MPKVIRDGIKAHHTGTVCLYDGYVKQKQQSYKDRQDRVKILRQWKNDIKRLEPLTNYYFTITPNI